MRLVGTFRRELLRAPRKTIQWKMFQIVSEVLQPNRDKSEPIWWMLVRWIWISRCCINEFSRIGASSHCRLGWLCSGTEKNAPQKCIEQTISVISIKSIAFLPLLCPCGSSNYFECGNGKTERRTRVRDHTKKESRRQNGNNAQLTQQSAAAAEVS